MEYRYKIFLLNYQTKYSTYFFNYSNTRNHLSNVGDKIPNNEYLHFPF